MTTLATFKLSLKNRFLLPVWLAWRYVFARKTNRFISFISLFSMIGIALGVAVIITVLSVMNGFRAEVQNKILNFTSHGELSDFTGKVDDWRALPKERLAAAGVVNYAPLIETQAILSHREIVRGVYLRGVAPEFEVGVTRLTDYMEVGRLDALRDGSFQIILGDDLARILGLRLRDKVAVLTHQNRLTPLGAMPRIRRFTVAGIFDLGMTQYDRHVALISLGDARALKAYDEENRVDGVHFAVADPFDAPRVSANLRDALGNDYLVRDWTQNHRSFFHALEMEKLILGVLLMLIIAIAAFNIVATLIMLVTEKRQDVAILKTMGMRPSAVLRIFVLHGCVLGFAGALFGVLLGLLLIEFLQPLAKAIEWLSGRPILSGDVYPITEIPAQLMLGDMAVVVGAAFILVLLATIYPARYAARLLPAGVLKQE